MIFGRYYIEERRTADRFLLLAFEVGKCRKGSEGMDEAENER